MGFRLKKLKQKIVNYFFDHPVQREVGKNSYYVLITALSAMIFAFGFNLFIHPNYASFNSDYVGVDIATVNVKVFASCGASGLAQSLATILTLCGFPGLDSQANLQIAIWVFYFLVNIPLCIFSFLKIGKKFTIYTILNVILVSLFGILFQQVPFFNDISSYVFNEPISRVLFAGLCTGISSCLAYSIDTSAGGIDVISYYVSEKKSAQIGIFSAAFNFVVIVIFCIVALFSGGYVISYLDVIKTASGVTIPDGYSAMSVEPALSLIMLLYTFLYMIIASMIVNLLNVQNKKECVQIITTNVNLAQVILANIPHGCTIIEGKGGYLGDKKYLIYMSVRKNEAKKVVKVAKDADPLCFINEFPVTQVFGKFYRKPIE